VARELPRVVVHKYFPFFQLSAISFTQHHHVSRASEL
jgi:hypothetical protein